MLLREGQEWTRWDLWSWCPGSAYVSLSQVVQAPQDVVMPTSRERESCPTRSMILPVAIDDLSGGQRPEQAPFQQVLLAPKAGIPYGRWAALCLLVLQESFEHADR